LLTCTWNVTALEAPGARLPPKFHVIAPAAPTAGAVAGAPGAVHVSPEGRAPQREGQRQPVCQRLRSERN
jgi:hypothetical protein